MTGFTGGLHAARTTLCLSDERHDFQREDAPSGSDYRGTREPSAPARRGRVRPTIYDDAAKQALIEGLPARLADLSARLRRLGYQPKPARRVYIPKANGGRRALGVPSFENRLVQDRLGGILQAIWEPEFRECSYGFARSEMRFKR